MSLSDQIERVQKRDLRIIYPEASYRNALEDAHLTTLFDRREELHLTQFIQIKENGDQHKLATIVACCLCAKILLNTYKDPEASECLLYPSIKTKRFQSSFIMLRSKINNFLHSEFLILHNIVLCTVYYIYVT